jgi:hypothetical protein
MDFVNSTRVTFDESNINEQKFCFPGPNVVFGKKDLPFFAYLNNINVEGALGCGPGKYPKYTDGKYCCVDSPVTEQEQLDYVNFLLEGAMQNISETVFKKYIQHVGLLIQIRNHLLKNKSLTDNLRIPEEYINTHYDSDSSDDEGTKEDWVQVWFDVMSKKSNAISRDRPDPVGGKTKRRKHNSKRSRKSRKNRKSMKNKK